MFSGGAAAREPDGERGEEAPSGTEIEGSLIQSTILPDPDAVDPPPVKILLFCFMFMFQGYGCLVGNPVYALRDELNSITGGRVDPAAYQDATVMFQWAKMAARMLQIAFLVFLNPRGICYLAYVFMFVAACIPPICIWGLQISELRLIALMYLIGGLGVGLFEGTFLSIISPLGKNTKTFVIMGAPLGFATHNIFLGTLIAMGLSPLSYYVVTAVCLPAGMWILHTKAPRPQLSSEGKGCAAFWTSVKRCNEWLLLLVPWLAAKVIGSFVLEDGFPLLSNTFNTKYVPLLDPSSEDQLLVPLAFYKPLYYFVLFAAGDTISRRVPQYLSIRRWQYLAGYIVLACALCVLGEGLYFLLIPVVTGLGVFIANFGNGFIYGLSAKFIDAYLPQEHRYTAYNLWCFAGDVGAVLGQGSLSVHIAESVCEGRHYTYVCKAKDALAALVI